MGGHNLTRRRFAQTAAAGLAAGRLNLLAAQTNILNFNPNMEYRRLGKTGLMVSAVSLGGHWKRLATIMPAGFKGSGYSEADARNIQDPVFLKARAEVVRRCVEVGLNYVDACSPEEILAYSRILRESRDKMYFGFSWHTREPRYPEYRTGRRLLAAFDRSLKEAGLDYVDLWRISLPMERVADLDVLLRVEEATAEALREARKQGKARFTGVSSHNRIWLKSMIEEYPSEIQTVLFPYTADSKELPDDSIFEAVRRHDVGVFGIKPFADNSLFSGDSSPASAHREQDDRRARLAIRYILGNPAITAPIPGLINPHQVDNVALAVKERRTLDLTETAELRTAAADMWARLPREQQWLRGWEYV